MNYIEVVKLLEHWIFSSMGDDGFAQIYYERLQQVLDFINEQNKENKDLKKEKCKLQKSLNQLEDFCSIAESKARKEFAEKLFEISTQEGAYDYVATYEIDYLLHNWNE